MKCVVCNKKAKIFPEICPYCMGGIMECGKCDNGKVYVIHLCEDCYKNFKKKIYEIPEKEEGEKIKFLVKNRIIVYNFEEIL